VLVWWLVVWIGLGWSHEGLHRTGVRLDHAVTEAPADAQLRMRRAENAWREGKVDEALADLDEAEALSGHRREHDLLRGLIAVDQEHWADATARLDHYLAAGGTEVDAFVARASAREAMGDGTGAESDLAAAMALQPTPALALLRFELLERRAKPRSAVAWLRVDLATVRTPVLRNTLCEALLAVDPHEAVACTEVLVEELAIPSSRALHADALDAAGQHAAAERERRALLDTLDTAIARRPTARLLLLRASLLDTLGEAIRARADAERATSLAPGWPEAQAFLHTLDLP
jgi:tetratricopeptide (TPR) repeat protein